MKSPLVYTVILNWQRPIDTVACVRSVQASGYGNLGIVVVDNGSRDGSVEQISLACPEVDLVTLEENLGFAGGNNAGINYALERGAELILLLNNDTVIEPNAISELVKALTREESWSIAVPKICYYDEPERIWAAGCRWRRCPPRVTMVGLNKQDAPPYNRARELEYATGCALLVRRNVFDKVGGFDPTFVNYQEDYDFFYRAREAGHRVIYVPQATVLHKVSKSLGKDAPRRWYYLGRNNVLFYRPGERFTWWALLGFLAWATAREVKNGHLLRMPAFWKGVRDGLALWKKQNAKQKINPRIRRQEHDNRC